MSLTLSHFCSLTVVHLSSHSGSRKHWPRSVLLRSRWQSLRGTAKEEETKKKRSRRVAWYWKKMPC